MLRSPPGSFRVHDEAELVRRTQAGDAEAFGMLYERYFDRVYRYVRVRVGNPTEAEDITEDSFVKALESIERFRWQGAPFVAWLFRIAGNLVIDTQRRKARRPETPVEEIFVQSEFDLSREVERQVMLEEVIAALGRLTELQQQVISLRFAAGLSIAETATSLGKTDGAVKAAQHAALAALQRLLAKEQGKQIHEPSI